MKKAIWMVLALVMSCQLTGCSLFASREMSQGNTFEKWEGSVPDLPDTVRCTVDEVSFDVPAGWTEIDSYEGAFRSPDGDAAFHLQGVSSLGSNTPQEFYEALLENYRTTHEVISSDVALTSLSLGDGSEGFVCNMLTYDGDVFYNIDLLVVPQKNKTITFAAQYKDRNAAIDVRPFTESVLIDIGGSDMISGNTFICEDESQLQFAADGSYIYYEAADDPTSAYVSGQYEVFYGQEAMDRVSSMTEYGLTAEELSSTLSFNMNGYLPGDSSLMYFLSEPPEEVYHVCLDTFYAVILHNEQFVEGDEITEIGKDSLYIGYYLHELDMADMVNANTANYTQWTLSAGGSYGGET